jgi:hypothetical protein
VLLTSELVLPKLCVLNQTHTSLQEAVINYEKLNLLFSLLYNLCWSSKIRMKGFSAVCFQCPKRVASILKNVTNVRRMGCLADLKIFVTD